jgi:regulator of replication initiation timing
MSVFRKSLTLQIALSLIISTVPMTSFAESNDSAGVRKAPAKKTEFGYDADKRKLCDLGGAKDKMAKLDAANKPKMDEIDELKKQIESINSEMQLLNSMGALKDNYLEGLSALAITQTSKEKIKNEKEKFKSLDNMKKVIRNGLMIDAIAFLLRNSNLEKDDAFTVKAICESSKKPADDYKKDSVCNNNNFLSNIFGNSLDKSLSNFKAAYRRVQITDKPALTEDIKKIIDSIPQDISPSAILKILNSTSPGITQLLKSDLSREALQS